LRPRRIRAALDAKLRRIKYVVLAAIVGCAAFGAAADTWTDRAVEIEPFKTAITLAFVRSWPFAAWAVALLLLSTVVFKGFCRYLCPLGAGLAILGRLRRFDWIARRAECGTPCQTCRHRCEYEAIEPDGRIVYADCFQCLECVAIHDSDERCASLIQGKRHRTIRSGRKRNAQARDVEKWGVLHQAPTAARLDLPVNSECSKFSRSVM